LPAKFTKSGKAEIDENTVEALMTELPQVQGLGELLMVQKRLSQLIEGDSSLVGCVTDDGRIDGVINPIGTMTSRATHFHANLAQVRGAKKPYGKRFRDCFEVPHGWVFVGADMEGLEGRGFSRYPHPLDGGAYAIALLSGDPHWASTKNVGFVGKDEVRDKENNLHVILREGSKRFHYAFIYRA